MKENDSDVIQILARKDFRRWRYNTDCLINGVPVYFDTAEKKWLKFKGYLPPSSWVFPFWLNNKFLIVPGVSIFSPQRNANMSELYVQFASGLGVRVQESYGLLDVMVVVPATYNETYKVGISVFRLLLTNSPRRFIFSTFTDTILSGDIRL